MIQVRYAPTDRVVGVTQETAQDSTATAATLTAGISETQSTGIPLGREAFGFEIVTELPNSPHGLGKGGRRHGRTGVIHTPHGDIHTPAFVPVATQATMKAVLPEQMRAIGSQCLLANAFHLFERPGEEIIDQAGGLGRFMNWSGPTYTDSGGFQVLSLGAGFKKTLAMDTTGLKSDDVIAKGKQRRAFVDEDGVTFKSPLNGSEHRFSAEISMGIQHKIGADIMFAFDELTTLMNTRRYQEESVERTFRWAKRCVAEHFRLTQERSDKPYQALFGVVQGANYEDLRRLAASQVGSLDFDGFGIGGAIEKKLMGEISAWICDELPDNKPRHVLGIAAVDDIFAAVENGGDTFDCVAPARVARNGAIYTHDGRWNVLRTAFKTDFGPLEEGCDCYTCQHYTRAYVHHLLKCREMTGSTLATIHNERFFVRLLDEIRASMDGGYFDEFRDSTLERFYRNGSKG
jgi:queuine tRNA-ribosyltransferase